MEKTKEGIASAYLEQVSDAHEDVSERSVSRLLIARSSRRSGRCS